MTWESAITTIIFSIVGYLIGSISFSIIISKILIKEDIRTKGSGNAGATNMLRNYGKKLGLIVLILDMLKPSMAVGIAVIASLLLSGVWSKIVFQVVAFFAVIGHIYPIYFNFKGGKGGATYAGFLFIIYWPLWFVGFFLFTVIVLKTKIVSLGTIVGPFIIIFVYIAFMFMPHMQDGWTHIVPNNTDWWVTSLFIALLSFILIYKHKPNLQRLIKGKERKLGQK